MKTILITGGAGYLGSHMAVRLLEAQRDIVIFDNLSNSKEQVLDRIEAITGKRPAFVKGDIRDRQALRELFATHEIDSVIHFAGLKAVGEGEAEPLRYYDNNVLGSAALFMEMASAGVRKIIFSSSATVYGDPGYPDYREDTPVAPVSVYGRTKLMVEQILCDALKADPAWRVAILRYFNPVGAHESGLIGEDPRGIPNNLMPFMSQVASGQREYLSVFGGDYPTVDGTGRRDYIHVEDLVSGHLAALNALEGQANPIVVNLGTGQSTSVLEMVAAFGKAADRPIPHRIVARRPGDLAEYYANPAKARELLGWQAKHDIERMCRDTWRWQTKNPNGY
ncbi:UDP-glucose 4-epimerase [Bordetella tumbae]|uniref:UDP-glucose 4-epimerase GalE n=1 Tax=Bordetella tumbae TaxID=1649139 RepID=UPI0039EF2EB0